MYIVIEERGLLAVENVKHQTILENSFIKKQKIPHTGDTESLDRCGS